MFDYLSALNLAVMLQLEPVVSRRSSRHLSQSSEAYKELSLGVNPRKT